MVDLENIKKTLVSPNALTLSRMLAAPVIVILLIFPRNQVTFFLAALIFSAAALTDYFDGYLARKYGQVSGFGKAMDPLADKMLIATAFIMLTAQDLIPGWVVCLIVARELGVTGLRTVLVAEGRDVSASIWGKLKTVFQIAALIFLLLHYPYLGLDCHRIGSWLLGIAVILTVGSGIDYFWRARKVIRANH